VTTPIRSTLAPVERIDHYWAVIAGSCLVLFCLVFVLYAVGLFSTSGGLVWIPWDAAILGLVAGCLVGYLRIGLVFAWSVGVAALLGAHADHALVGLADRPLAERLGYFARLDGLTFYAVEGVLVGTIAFLAGTGIRAAVRTVRR
jgi:hypothetical protein